MEEVALWRITHWVLETLHLIVDLRVQDLLVNNGFCGFSLSPDKVICLTHESLEFQNQGQVLRRTSPTAHLSRAQIVSKHSQIHVDYQQAVELSVLEYVQNLRIKLLDPY